MTEAQLQLLFPVFEQAMNRYFIGDPDRSLVAQFLAKYALRACQRHPIMQHAVIPLDELEKAAKTFLAFTR